jgi:hypothetical protein
MAKGCQLYGQPVVLQPKKQSQRGRLRDAGAEQGNYALFRDRLDQIASLDKSSHFHSHREGIGPGRSKGPITLAFAARGVGRVQSRKRQGNPTSISPDGGITKSCRYVPTTVISPDNNPVISTDKLAQSVHPDAVR